MHTRRATQADASAIADIAVLCFWEDELYDFTHPYKKQYPADFRNAFLRMQAIRFNSPGWAVHVAVTDQDDGGSASPGQVVGYSSWIRRGTSEEAKRWQQDTYGMKLERYLSYLNVAYTDVFRLDKSVSYDHLRKWLDHTKDPFSAKPDLLKLQNVCVHPSFQRRGIAGLLVDWGKERAREERCPIGLSSSAMGRGVYERAGFRRYGTLKIKGFPVDDVPLFLWEPEGMKRKKGIEEVEEVVVDSNARE